MYSAMWKDGPLYHYGKYTRISNEGVALKCLHNSQDMIEFVINEVNIFTLSLAFFKNNFIYFLFIFQAKKYLTKEISRKFFKLYGISQNPNTNDFILILNIWESGNNKIDDFIQEIQYETYLFNKVFEWIPYNQFDKIKVTSKNGSITMYSAMWKDGPLYYHYGKYTRISNEGVALKCLHNSQDIMIEFVINEVNIFTLSLAFF
jgi:hypothetical protein